MPPENSSSPDRSSRPPSSKRKLSRGTVGALVGAAVGGVLGTVVARKVRAANMRKLVPNRMPALGKRAFAVAKNVASDAMFVAKATAARAASQAISDAKSAAQHFVVDTALGQPPTPPKPVLPALPSGARPKTSRRKPRSRMKAKRRAAGAKSPRRVKSR